MIDIASFMQRQPGPLAGVAESYMRGQQFRDQRETNASLRELNQLKLQDVRDKMAQAQTLRDLISESVTTTKETTPFQTDEEQAFGLPALTGNIASEREVTGLDLAGLKSRAAKAGLHDVVFDLEKREQDAAVKDRDYKMKLAELDSLERYRQGQLKNDAEDNRIKAIKEKNSGAEIKAADTNALYRQAAGLFGGTFDDQGNLIALDPKVRGKVADLAARAEAHFMKNRGMGYAGAVKKAAQELGIMEGGTPNPAQPGQPAIDAASKPGARPAGVSDDELRARAQRFVDAGGDPAAAQKRLKDWGVATDAAPAKGAPKSVTDQVKESRWFNNNKQRYLSLAKPWKPGMPRTMIKKEEAITAATRIAALMPTLSGKEAEEAQAALNALGQRIANG